MMEGIVTASIFSTVPCMSYEDIDVNAKRLFFYILKLEEQEGVEFESADGGLLFLDYTNLDWKAFTKEIAATMGAMPKTMQVYFGNEPINMADVGFSKYRGDGPGMDPYITAMVNGIVSEDCRGGILNLLPIRENLHPLDHALSECPPAMGLYIAVKATPMQLLDYESSFARIFGHANPAHTSMSFSNYGSEEEKIEFLKRRHAMLPEVQEILSRHLKLPFSDQCKLSHICSMPLVSRKHKAA